MIDGSLQNQLQRNIAAALHGWFFFPFVCTCLKGLPWQLGVNTLRTVYTDRKAGVGVLSGHHTG